MSNLHRSYPLLDWDDYRRFCFQGQRPGRISHAELTNQLQQLAGGQVTVELAGKSVEDRDIFCVRAGQGPVEIALWSQMHGNEPTHTVVLVDLLRMLATAPDHPAAAAILQQCRLSFLPMLNPDGAEKWQRLNAQHIDINRDARRLHTPEARILHKFIRERPFEFAFNLHNQIPWRTVDGTQLTAISLLVPPLDEQGTESPASLRAKRLASCLRQAVEPQADGRIARYVAGYMPRCFGEWVQAQGVSTLLVEAGGCPQQDVEWLTQLHFFALASTLLAITQGQVDEADLAAYDSLPQASEKNRFDLVIRQASVSDQLATAEVDLGIVRSIAKDGRLASQIVTQGDLDGWSARDTIDAAGLLVLPGQIAIDPDFHPDRLDLDTRLLEYARQGVTTLVGVIDPADPEQASALERMATGNLPINVGFLGLLARPTASNSAAQLVAQIRGLLKLGVLGLLFQRCDRAPDYWQQQVELLDELGWFLGYEDGLSSHAVATPADVSGWCQQTGHLAGRLGLAGRDSVSQASADVAIVQPPPAEQVVHLLVDGIVVIRDGVVLDHRVGKLLTRN